MLVLCVDRAAESDGESARETEKEYKIVKERAQEIGKARKYEENSEQRERSKKIHSKRTREKQKERQKSSEREPACAREKAREIGKQQKREEREINTDRQIQ